MIIYVYTYKDMYIYIYVLHGIFETIYIYVSFETGQYAYSICLSAWGKKHQ